MLKKLRFRFILINMTIVTLMLTAVFFLLYYSTARHLEEESLHMMMQVSSAPPQLGGPNRLPDDVRLPYFTVLVTRAGETAEIGGGFFDLSNEELPDSLLQTALASHTASGVIREYSLRFLRRDIPRGRLIVFADMTSELSTLKNLRRTFLSIGISSFFIFLGISVLLAKRTVKPVEDAWLQQKQFVADASHELKTPLTVIMTDAELLSMPDCSAKDREKLSDSVLTMSRQMSGLVEDMLELARIDSGSTAQPEEDVDFSRSVSDAALTFEPVFFEKGLPFSYDIEPGITVRGREAHLNQLAGILLDNASKYVTPGGETKLQLKKTRPGHCQLEVADIGEPLSGEELNNLFKRFYRADKVRGMNMSYGLGLPIAQSIAEEHRGRISAESLEGWNRFRIELPCEK